MIDPNHPTRPAALDEPSGGAPVTGDSPPLAAGVRFEGRTPRKSESLRLGVVVGTALVLALGAAVAMGASPAASASPDASAATGGSGSGGPSTGVPAGAGAWEGRRGDHGPLEGRGFGDITVTAISGSAISLETEDGWSRTITVTDSTMVTRNGEAATLADLSVGDAIRFQQTRNADDSWTITAIAIELPRVAGTVSAVTADSITVTPRDGTTQTIRTTEATRYRTGREDGSRADIVVGATIVAFGEAGTDGTFTATSIGVRLPHVLGAVTATSADTVTITRRDGTTLTVHVGADTKIRVGGTEDASLADVKVGMLVGAIGTQRADGSLDATQLLAGYLRPGHGRGGPGHDGPMPDASAAPEASSGTGG
jgi:hypothetical protein